MRHLLIVLALALAGFGFAQESGQESDAGHDDTFWYARRRMQTGAAAQLILVRNPFTIAAMRIQAERFVVWDQTEADLPFSLNSDWLDEIADRTPIRPTSDRLQREHPADWAFFLALNEAVLKASKFPVEAFAQHAERNTHVTIAHLNGDPARYRG